MNFQDFKDIFKILFDVLFDVFINPFIIGFYWLIKGPKYLVNFKILDKDINNLPTGTILAVQSRPPIPAFHYGVVLHVLHKSDNTDSFRDFLLNNPDYCIFHYNVNGYYNKPQGKGIFVEKILRKINILGKSFVNLSTIQQFKGNESIIYYRYNTNTYNAHHESNFSSISSTLTKFLPDIKLDIKHTRLKIMCDVYTTQHKLYK